MSFLPSGSIFRELQVVHDTGYFSAQPSLEDRWQQVGTTSTFILYIFPMIICVIVSYIIYTAPNLKTRDPVFRNRRATRIVTPNCKPVPEIAEQEFCARTNGLERYNPDSRIATKDSQVWAEYCHDSGLIG